MIQNHNSRFSHTGPNADETFRFFNKIIKRKNTSLYDGIPNLTQVIKDIKFTKVIKIKKGITIIPSKIKELNFTPSFIIKQHNLFYVVNIEHDFKEEYPGKISSARTHQYNYTIEWGNPFQRGKLCGRVKMDQINKKDYLQYSFKDPKYHLNASFKDYDNGRFGEDHNGEHMCSFSVKGHLPLFKEFEKLFMKKRE